MEQFFPLLRNVVPACGFTRIQSYTDQYMSILSDPLLATSLLLLLFYTLKHKNTEILL